MPISRRRRSCQRQGAGVRATTRGLLNVAVEPVSDGPVAGVMDVQADLGHGASENVLDCLLIGRGVEVEVAEDPGVAVFGAPEVGAGAIVGGGGGTGRGWGWGWGRRGPSGLPGEEV